jgi:TonB family protein
MSTRAFLLCGDEKAVHAVAQILDELEVSFEHSGEPPFALKRLATQRFDLLIVDCDNAQNATQVFNSARASNLNKNSIAVAVVEGKAGVPNAFRLGASLVLTKPVSLEQARNTLRTGIGMTKKDAVEVKPSVAAPVLPPAPASVPPATPIVSTPAAQVTAPAPSPTVASPVVSHPPASAAPAVPVPVTKAPVAPASITPPATAALVQTKPTVVAPAEKPVIAPKPPVPVQEHKPALTNFTEAKAQTNAGSTAVARAAAAAAGVSAASTAPLNASEFESASSGAGSKVAEPEKMSPSDDKNKASSVSDTKDSVLRIEDPLADEADVLDPLKDHGVPSFGAMGKQPFAGFENEAPKRSKAPLIAALVLIVAGGGAYTVWTTQPNFRAFMAWEYGNIDTKIDAMRGKAPVAAAAKPQPAPVAPAPVPPVTAPPATQSPENIDVAMAPGGSSETSANTTSPTPSEPNATGATSATVNPAVPTSTPAASSPVALDAKPPKSAKIQPAKQDTASGHPNASLVPASASLPSTTVTKAPSSDLLELPEDFADDQVIHRVHPAYPKQALVKKLHGSVVLQAIINKQGKVDSLQLVSGDATLAQAAASAVKQWRYRPYWHNNEPTDFQTRVTVDFKLP